MVPVGCHSNEQGIHDCMRSFSLTIGSSKRTIRKQKHWLLYYILKFMVARVDIMQLYSFLSFLAFVLCDGPCLERQRVYLIHHITALQAVIDHAMPFQQRHTVKGVTDDRNYQLGTTPTSTIRVIHHIHENRSGLDLCQNLQLFISPTHNNCVSERASITESRTLSG
jgi:hypothetical protein